MEKLKLLGSITCILSGTLLYLYNSLSGGWTSGLAATVGFILFITGLDILKTCLETNGKKGAHLLLLAGIISGTFSLIASVPIMELLPGPGFIFSFFLIIWGVVQFNRLSPLNQIGKSSSSQIIIAMIVAALDAFMSLLPFVENIVASLYTLISILLPVTYWPKVQTDLVAL